MARVGIFWKVAGRWVVAGCPIEEASSYGDALTYDGGHAEHWEQWQKAGGRWLAEHDFPLEIMTSEYEEHPRGRVVKQPDHFVIYADRRLLGKKSVAHIITLFDLRGERVIARTDSHYR